MWIFPDETESLYSSFTLVSTQPAECFDLLTPSSLNQGPAHLPIICYIDRTQLTSNRNNRFRIAPGPGKSTNEPAFRLRELRAVSSFLHFRIRTRVLWASFLKYRRSTSTLLHLSLTNASPACPQSKASRHTLTFTTSSSGSSPTILERLIYTGNITEAFLEKFHNPFKAPPNDDDAAICGITTEYTRVLIWPILGLRERLGKLLGRDIFGAFNPKEIETWGKDPETSHGRKRKHEVDSKSMYNSPGGVNENQPSVWRNDICKEKNQ